MQSFFPPHYTLEIFSDASLSGWGAMCGTRKTHGFWNAEESHEHINVLELQAAFFGLQCFASQIMSGHILLRCDNTTTVAYINKMGGLLSPTLNALARSLWQWCESGRILVFASYISSADNWEVDFESRRPNPDTEVELSWSAFHYIEEKLGSCEIDIFASRVNAKCNRYLSWFSDPGAEGVDAFTHSWSVGMIYAFPPFCLITRTLQKIRADLASGILIVPNWPTQPWFPALPTLTNTSCVRLSYSDLIATSSSHLPKTLSLIAVRF